MNNGSGDAHHGSTEHIIVLMLENRSFDHLLGNVALNGNDPPIVTAAAGDRYAMPLDPGHSHVAAMQQLGANKRRPYEPDNRGFVQAYLDKARGKSPELRDRLKVRLWIVGISTVIAGVASVAWPWIAAAWVGFLLLLALGGFLLVWQGTSSTGHLPRTILQVIYGKTKLRGLVIGAAALVLVIGSFVVAIVTDWLALRIVNAVVLAAVGFLVFLQGTKLGHHDTVENSGDVLERAIASSFTPSAIEPLAQLAAEFATCTRWFSPVPGETWPNRNFVHAGTSDGAVDIEYRLFLDATIFDRLQEHADELTAPPWRVYFRGVPQVLAFPSLWDYLGPEAGADAPFRTIDRLWTDIDHEDLPAYSFIEPFHGTAFDATEFAGVPNTTDSQHSGNNKIPIAEYDTGDHQTAGRDFVSGMRLVAEVYERLRAKPDLFEKTVLVITYDEHGGFPDREPPPVDAVPPKPPNFKKRLYNWWLSEVYGMRASSYDFTMLGPRVPTIIVSPWIPAKPVNTTFDHTSIPRTVRKVFGLHEPLSDREAAAATFDDLVTSSTALRRDLPDLSAWRYPAAEEAVESAALTGAPSDDDLTRSMSFIGLTLLNYVMEVPGRTPNAAAVGASESRKQRARNKAQRQARRESLAAIGHAAAGVPEPLDQVNEKVALVMSHIQQDASVTA